MSMGLVICIKELIVPTVRNSMDFCQPYLKEPSTVFDQHENQTKLLCTYRDCQNSSVH